MTTIIRQQLLDLESDVLGDLINKLPADLQDQVMLLMAGLLETESIEIPDEYLQGIVDDL